MLGLVYKDISGKTYWVDKEGEISKDLVEMTDSEANQAITNFMCSCNGQTVCYLDSNEEFLTKVKVGE